MDREEYQGLLSARLAHLKQRAIEELRSILLKPLPEADAILDVEIFPDSLFDGLPIRLFFMAPSGGTELAPSHELLAGQADAAWSTAERDAIIQAGEEDDAFDHLSIDGPAILAWFVDCWEEAGGSNYPLDAFVGEHDSDKSLRLRTKEWTRSEGKWRLDHPWGNR